MRNHVTTLTIALIVGLGLIVGCADKKADGKKEEPAKAGKQEQRAEEPEPAAEEPAETDVPADPAVEPVAKETEATAASAQEPVVELSEEEAAKAKVEYEATASKMITKDNAQAEADRLLKEIDSDQPVN